MKPLLLVLFTFITSVAHADINYSGVWKDTQGQFYSIHQLADSLVVAELSSHKEELFPFMQGNLRLTDNSLDLAISGHGFFILELDDGSYIYTRKGDFRIGADKTLINGQGEKLVMENEGVFPDDNFVGFVVERDGTVNLQTPDDRLIKFDRIKLALIAPENLQYLSATRFKAINEEAVIYIYPNDEQRSATIQQYSLEMLSWTAQNWVAYTGKLIDNHANINRISEDDNEVYSKVITFNNESTATFGSPKSRQSLDYSSIFRLGQKEDVQLIRVF